MQISLTTKSGSDSIVVRRMLGERPALTFEEKKHWLFGSVFGSTFHVSGHPMTVENFHKSVAKECLEDWMERQI